MRVTYSFPWAKEDIGNKLRTSRGKGPADSLILGGVLTSSSSIDILEDFIETELAETLGGVANQSRGPSKSEALESFSSLNLREAITYSLIKTRKCL